MKEINGLGNCHLLSAARLQVLESFKVALLFFCNQQEAFCFFTRERGTPLSFPENSFGSLVKRCHQAKEVCTKIAKPMMQVSVYRPWWIPDLLHALLKFPDLPEKFTISLEVSWSYWILHLLAFPAVGKAALTLLLLSPMKSPMKPMTNATPKRMIDEFNVPTPNHHSDSPRLNG